MGFPVRDFGGWGRRQIPHNPRLQIDGARRGVKVASFIGALVDGFQLAQQHLGVEAVGPRHAAADVGDARTGVRPVRQPVALVAQRHRRIPGVRRRPRGVAAQHIMLAKRLVAGG